MNYKELIKKGKRYCKYCNIFFSYEDEHLQITTKLLSIQVTQDNYRDSSIYIKLFFEDKFPVFDHGYVEEKNRFYNTILLRVDKTGNVVIVELDEDYNGRTLTHVIFWINDEYCEYVENELEYSNRLFQCLKP